MITEKGKEYIARNFGVNNCFALEEVVPCTVYTEGAPNERVLDTSTILFLLVTEVADWVSTAARKFTLGDLIAANDGSYISMMDALEIEAYCIAGAPPVTPTEPVAAATISITATSPLPLYFCAGGDAPKRIPHTLSGRLLGETSELATGTKEEDILEHYHVDFAEERIYETVRGGYNIKATWNLGRGTVHFDVQSAGGISIKVDKTTCQVNDSIYLKGQYIGDSGAPYVGHVIGFYGYINGTRKEIGSKRTEANGMYGFAYRPETAGNWEFMAYNDFESPRVSVRVTAAGPPTVSVKDFEIVNPIVNCDSYNCEVRLNIKNNSNSSSSVYMRLDVDGAPKIKRHVYLLRGASKPQVSLFSFAGISDGYHNLTIAVGKDVDTDTYTHRFLVGEPGIEPPAVTPTAKITKAGIISELGKKGTIKTAAVSTAVGINKWYMYRGRLNYDTSNFEKAISILNIATRNPPTRTTDISLTENKTSVSELDRNWVLARLGELPFKAPVTPPITPPVTPAVEPPEQIKAWIVANYGDGTRVTSDGWRKLNVAKMNNTLAALPAGYTKAAITEGVVLWAKANPNWEIQTICGWINSIGVTNLTEDHGLYVYNLAIGWTTLANSIYATLSPKPSKPAAAIVTEDNGLGVYDYAIGWNTIANTITGCNF